MRRNLILIILLYNCLAFAQNYQTILPNSTAAFTDFNFVRVDSTAILANGSTEHYFTKLLITEEEYDENNAVGFGYVNKGNLLGSHVIFKPTGIEQYVNAKQDTFRFETLTKFLDSWELYKDNSLSIFATVIKHDTASFLGLIDSVKTVELTTINNNGDTLKTHFATGKRYEITKSYGWLTTASWEFFLTPQSNAHVYRTRRPELLELKGHSNPKIGLQNLDGFEIFDFEVGNQLHGRSGLEGDFNDSDLFITEYLSKKVSLNQDTITYISKTNNSIEEQIIIRTDLGSLPGELTPSKTFFDMLEVTHIELSNDSCGGLLKKIFSDRPYGRGLNGDDTWSEVVLLDGPFSGSGDIYYKGLGGPYFSFGRVGGSSFSLETFSFKRLSYYKKEESTCGAPLVSGLFGKGNNINISLYPNPSTGTITIESPFENKESRVTIRSLDGKFVVEKSMTQKIQISGLVSGIYLVELQPGETVLTNRLIVE